MRKLNSKQLKRLADLFLDVSKGLFLAAIAIPIFSYGDIIRIVLIVAGGLVLVYVTLLIERKLYGIR